MKTGMTLGAWIFMISSWSLVIGVTVWCVIKLINGNKANKKDPPIETD